MTVTKAKTVKKKKGNLIINYEIVINHCARLQVSTFLW